MTSQKLFIVGNLEHDPQLRYSDDMPITEFSVTVFMDNQTTRFCINAAKDCAEIANSLVIGQQVLVEGYLNPDQSTGCPKVHQSADGKPEASYIVTAEKIVPFKIITSSTTMSYEEIKSLYWDARQRYHIAISKLQEPDKPTPRSYMKPLSMNSYLTYRPQKFTTVDSYLTYRRQKFATADKKWLVKLQQEANTLYEQIVSLNRVIEFLAARGHELYLLVPKFIGLQARRTQEMAAEIRRWSTELKVRRDEKLRLADEWQSKADQWELLMMTESYEESKLRWAEEENEREKGIDSITADILAEEAGYESWDDYADAMPD